MYVYILIETREEIEKTEIVGVYTNSIMADNTRNEKQANCKEEYNYYVETHKLIEVGID